MHLRKVNNLWRASTLTSRSCTPTSQISRTTISDQVKKQYGFDLIKKAKPGANIMHPCVDTAR